MATLTIEIPERIMSLLGEAKSPIQDLVIKALEQYFDTTNPEREKLTKIQEFRQSCLMAGMEAETMGLTEEQIENNIEQIKEEVYQEIYGEHSYS
jgi:hypothetical protein